MKKIIDGKVYNTETAEEIGEAQASCYCNDFRWWKESLFRTKKGTWFLAGTGHAMSHWSERGPDGHGPGRGIRALTEEEARSWAEKYLDAEEYLAIFPAVEA
jgi:hypothetical protein